MQTSHAHTDEAEQTGSQQSPIALHTDQALYSPALVVPDFAYLDPIIGCFSQDNPGHNVFRVDKSVRASIKFRGLTANLVQIHMHGESEHQLSTELPADGEIHFVHAISSPDHAVEPSTYIVLSAFLHCGEGCQKDGLLRLLRYQQGLGDDPNCPPFPAEDLNELRALKDFYYYRGSLTGPPYTEDVTWVVFRHPVRIAAAALELLKPATHEARAVHPLNRRVVLRNFE